MELLITAVAAGIIFGIVAGILPGVGNTVIILTMTPILFQWPPEISIIFYAVCMQVGNFASTVSSINMGLLGDITGEPALRERFTIVKNQLTLTSLKFSAISSLISSVIGSILLLLMLSYAAVTTFALRTEVKFLLLLIILSALLFWPKNKFYVNILLILTGFGLSLIGHHEQFFNVSDVHILTFGISQLYSGIPVIVILCSFLAVPAIVKLLELKSINSYDNLTKTEFKFPVVSCIRGVTIGTVLGMIPMIGTMISSNVAWTVERFFNKKDSAKDSMARLTSAESANNSSSITVLIPLLTIGLAIIPSEMILLGVLESKSWVPNLNNWMIWGIYFYQWLALSIVVAAIVSYFVCYVYVKSISVIISANIRLISYVSVALIATSVAYSGYTVDNITYYLLMFFLFSIVTSINKITDYMPLVVGYLLSDELLNSSRVILNLYFNWEN